MLPAEDGNDSGMGRTRLMGLTSLIKRSEGGGGYPRRQASWRSGPTHWLSGNEARIAAVSNSLAF